ncbi:MAG: Nif3-like dinuclear metal center hexameric protein [Verrucomicrobiota bacterium]
MPKSRPPRRAAGQPGAPLSAVVRHLETTLEHQAVADWSSALNGLQVENRGRIHRIGAAVDACEATLRQAAERGVDFLLVHHGLFWGGLQPVQGPLYRKLRLALDADLAVFSSHLPLDAHPRFGNNALLAKALGFKRPEPFFLEKGRFIGLKARLPLARAALAARLETAVGGPVKLIAGGPERTGVVGVVSGGAGAELFKAAAEGVDTFITGEGPHWSYPAAEELGLNLLYAGHYATETFGVKALAAHLARSYRLPWEFIDHPTGL